MGLFKALPDRRPDDLHASLRPGTVSTLPVPGRLFRENEMAFPPIEPQPESIPPPPDVENPDQDPFQFPPDPEEDDPRDPGTVPVPEDIPPPM